MPEKGQLFLFDWANPLTERIGRGFFLSLPKTPGVYLMRDERGTVIYVGTSKNLRQRLNSYRHVHPSRDSRKTCRLVCTVRSIEVQGAEGPEAAALLENELIRKHRPRFNAAKTHPESHVFVGWRVQQGRLLTTYTNREDLVSAWGSEVSAAGAFTSPATRRGIASMRRLIWWACQPGLSLCDLPYLLNRFPPIPDYEQALPQMERRQAKRFERKMRDFFTGQSPAVLGRLVGANGERLTSCPDGCLRRLLEHDLEAAHHFFRVGPSRLKDLPRMQPTKQKGYTPQWLLDDLPLHALRQRTA